MAFFLEVLLYIISIESRLNMLLVEGRFQSVENGRCHCRRNQGVSLESGSF